jgi:hypothetical protein
MKTVKEAEREWFEGSVQSAAALMELAVTHIDRRFGDDYAKWHPELTAAFMQTAIKEFATRLGKGETGESVR